MQELGGLTTSVASIKLEDITDMEKKLLTHYRNRTEPIIGSEFTLEVQMQDSIHFSFSEDFHGTECVWLSSPMFSLLRFEDFFWLWVAVLLEKSIVVVSCNLALLTSTV